jgi:hypothetical protein
VSNLEVFGLFLRIPKRDEPAFRRDCGALRGESRTDVKSICCNGFIDLRGDQNVGYEHSGFSEILGREIASPYDGSETSQSAYWLDFGKSSHTAPFSERRWNVRFS